MDTPSSDFEELLACLNAHHVKALVVGGHALAFHGRPRYTKDLVVLVEPTPDNAGRLIDALVEFGFGDVGLSPDDFVVAGKVVQLGFAPNRIDLLTSIDGVSFDQAWQVELRGCSVPFRSPTWAEASSSRTSVPRGGPRTWPTSMPL